MKRLLSKKWALAATIGAVAMLAAVGAYAYWTTAGSGSGSATAAANYPNNLVVSGSYSPSVADLAPGKAVTVPVTVTNPAGNSGHAYLKEVDVVVDAVATGCDDSWFTFPSVPFNQSIASGASATVDGTLTFTNLANTNQDACKGSAITLTYTVDNS